MKKIWKILIVVIVLFALLIGVGFIFDKDDKSETDVIDNTVDSNVDSTDPNKSEVDEEEVIKNIPTTEIPSLSETDEQTLEVQEVESEGFEEQGEIAYESGEDNFSKFEVGVKRGLTYYSQVDPRWKNEVYSSIGDNSQTIGTSGCGPTSAAMIITSIKGTITPPDMAKLYVMRGYRSANNGTYWSAFKWTADYFDVVDYRETSSLDTAISLLNNNHYLIASCNQGLFTYGGHFIVIYGYEDTNGNGAVDSSDNLKIYDPYLYNGKFDVSSRRGKVRVDGNTVYCTIYNFRNYANYRGFFAFGYTPDEVTTPLDKPVTVQSYTMYVNAKSGLNVRTGAGTNYTRIKTLTNGTQVTVYETSGNWSRIGDGQWVCSDYLISKTTNTPTSTSYKVKVTAKSGLRIRSGASTSYSIKGSYRYGTIVTILQEYNGWGRTSSGWICLDYTSKVSSNTSTSSTKTVVAKSGLNVRRGPGTGYARVTTYRYGTRVNVSYIQNGWAKLTNGYWVCATYLK